MIKKEVKCVFSDPDYSWPIRAARLSAQSIDPHVNDDTAEDVIEAFERIRKRWLRCFNMLEATGMFDGQKLRIKLCRQCPPPGFRKLDPKSTGCRQAYLCPFCWMRRYAEDTYNRFAEVIEIGDGYVQLPAKFLSWQLTTVITTEQILVEDTLDSMLRSWKYLIDLKHIEHWQALHQSVAAFSLMVMEPVGKSAQAGKSKWKGSIRSLLLNKPGKMLAVKEQLEGAWRTEVRTVLLTDEARWRLSMACGAVAEYPSNLLRANFFPHAELSVLVRRFNEPGAKSWRAAECYGRVRGTQR